MKLSIKCPKCGTSYNISILKNTIGRLDTIKLKEFCPTYINNMLQTLIENHNKKERKFNE